MKKGDKALLSIKQPNGTYIAEIDEVESVRKNAGKTLVRLKKLGKEYDEKDPVNEVMVIPAYFLKTLENRQLKPDKLRLNERAMQIFRKYNAQAPT